MLRIYGLSALLLSLLLSACTGPRETVRDEEAGRVKAVTAPTQAEVYHIEAGDQAHPAVSPDGNLLAYQSNVDGNWEIYLQPVVGGTPMKLTSDSGSDEDPVFSPDGTQLLFTWAPAGPEADQPRDIYLINRDGSGRRPVIQSPADDWAPVYLPDGSGFLFLSDRNDSNPDPQARFRTLYLYSFAGGELQEPFAGLQITGSSWDERRHDYLVTGREGWFWADSSLTICDTLVTPSRLAVSAGVIPAGGDAPEAICFGEREEHRRQLFRVNLASGAEFPLTATELDARWPVLTPDGETLFFCAKLADDPASVFNLYRLQLTTPAPAPATR